MLTVMVKCELAIPVKLIKLPPNTSIEHKAKVCSKIIKTVCNFYDVKYEKVLSTITWRGAHIKAVSSVIYALTEIGIERHVVARLIKKQPQTIATNLYRLRKRIRNVAYKKEFICCITLIKKEIAPHFS